MRILLFFFVSYFVSGKAGYQLNEKNMRGIVILILVLQFVAFGIAQEKNSEVLPRPSWGVSITPNLLKKSSIDNRGGKYQLGSSPQFGGEFLIKYHYSFIQMYRLIFAAGVN